MNKRNDTLDIYTRKEKGYIKECMLKEIIKKKMLLLRFFKTVNAIPKQNNLSSSEYSNDYLSNLV